MSFDARSLERLQQLGRSLPKPLPKPQAPSPADTPASQKRHRVETETDPEALFRELMLVSPDGTVPPHLLDRLKQAERDKVHSQQEAQRRAQQQAQRQGSANGGLKPRGAANELRPNQQRRKPASSEELELYTAFQHLLLEGDEEDA
jgi:type IV secretory pathway VirB10-like protein